MAERIPPGFSIPLGFYDGPEVRSIPRRVRAVSLGVFLLAGNYSASRLTDGYVDNETLAGFGCGPAVREALKNIRGGDGLPDPIWVEEEGGIRFAKWSRWQRTKAEVTAHRDAEAARKREARARAKQTREANALATRSQRVANALPTQSKRVWNAFGDESSQPADMPERPAGHLPESQTDRDRDRDRELLRDSPLADTEPEQGQPVWEERGQERGRSDPVHHSAARLVSTLVPANTPAAVKTGLRLAASQLIVGDGLPSEVVAEALRRWTSRPDAGPGLLAHIASSVLREGTAPAPQSKLRDWAEFVDSIPEDQHHQQPSRKAIEQ